MAERPLEAGAATTGGAVETRHIDEAEDSDGSQDERVDGYAFGVRRGVVAVNLIRLSKPSQVLMNKLSDGR